MGRKERRAAHKHAKQQPSRKTPKADNRVLILLAVLVVLVVVVTYSLRYSGTL